MADPSDGTSRFPFDTFYGDLSGVIASLWGEDVQVTLDDKLHKSEQTSVQTVSGPVNFGKSGSTYTFASPLNLTGTGINTFAGPVNATSTGINTFAGPFNATSTGVNTFGGPINGSFAAGGSDYDKYLVSDSGIIKYRTGIEVLGDIGAAAVSHATTHQDGEGDEISVAGLSGQLADIQKIKYYPLTFCYGDGGVSTTSGIAAYWLGGQKYGHYSCMVPRTGTAVLYAILVNSTTTDSSWNLRMNRVQGNLDWSHSGSWDESRDFTANLGFESRYYKIAFKTAWTVTEGEVLAIRVYNDDVKECGVASVFLEYS